MGVLFLSSPMMAWDCKWVGGHSVYVLAVYERERWWLSLRGGYRGGGVIWWVQCGKGLILNALSHLLWVVLLLLVLIFFLHSDLTLPPSFHHPNSSFLHSSPLFLPFLFPPFLLPPSLPPSMPPSLPSSFPLAPLAWLYHDLIWNGLKSSETHTYNHKYTHTHAHTQTHLDPGVTLQRGGILGVQLCPLISSWAGGGRGD